jgi:hypothetical protein
MQKHLDSVAEPILRLANGLYPCENNRGLSPPDENDMAGDDAMYT